MSDFGIPESVALSTQCTASRFVDVEKWDLDAKSQIVLPAAEMIEARKCSLCETDLNREKQKAQEWKRRVEEEKAKVGECIYRRSCKLAKVQDMRR